MDEDEAQDIDHDERHNLVTDRAGHSSMKQLQEEFFKEVDEKCDQLKVELKKSFVKKMEKLNR